MKATGFAFHKFRSTLKPLVIGMSLALFVPAVAGQQAPVPASSPVEGNPQAVLNYWTAARMQQAVPIDLPQASGQEAADDFITSTSNEPEAFDPSTQPKSATNDTVSQLLDSLATSNAPFTLAPSYSYPFPFTRYDVAPLLYAPQLANGLAGVAPSFPYKTVGKLFVTTDAGVNAVCSASVIFDHLVLTARHCIYNQDTGRFFTNITFAPGYFNANNPPVGGRWAGRRLYTWARPAPNWRYDIGFVQLFDDDRRGCGGSVGGRPIETYTGHLGSFWGGSYTAVHWNQFGYPAAGMFNGQVMVEADSSTGQVGGVGSWNDTVQVGNDMTGGSSGGPWIRHMFPNRFGALQNLANGLNSFGPGGRPAATGSPAFFQYNYGSLYTGAKALACP